VKGNNAKMMLAVNYYFFNIVLCASFAYVFEHKKQVVSVLCSMPQKIPVKRTLLIGKSIK
jgi:hypothetical protein